jgi:hypothetical protein
MWVMAVGCLGLVGCAGVQHSSPGGGFRHSVLRGLAPAHTTSAGGSARLALVAPRERLQQRCTRVFEHPVLNHCERWIPPETEAPRGPLPGCKTGGPGCRLALARLAREQLKRPRFSVSGRSYRRDCSGFVMATLSLAGVDLRASLPKRAPGEGGVSLLYRMARERGLLHRNRVPDVGDLVFFDDTHDRDKDGRADDPLTHVGLVERVEPDGTITFIHRVRRGTLRYRMNLFRPDERRDPKTGKVLNHYLRLGASPDGRRLTGQLFHAFATVLPK